MHRSPDCRAELLCAGCYGHTVMGCREQARVTGEVWAEQVGRRPEHRGQASWPVDARALAIARRRCVPLSADQRVVDELAAVCLRGAAAWWERRPAGYRA